MLGPCGAVVAAETGLIPHIPPSAGVTFAQANFVFDCRRLYAGELKKSEFLAPTLLSHSPDDDFHHVYVCEIENCYVNKL